MNSVVFRGMRHSWSLRPLSARKRAEFCASTCARFPQQVRHMELHSVVADIQLRPDLAVSCTRNDKSQHLPLPVRQGDDVFERLGFVRGIQRQTHL